MLVKKPWPWKVSRAKKMKGIEDDGGRYVKSLKASIKFQTQQFFFFFFWVTNALSHTNIIYFWWVKSGPQVYGSLGSGSRLKLMGAPYCGYRSMSTVGACWQLGANLKEKRCSIMARVSFACKMARFWPMQVLTPSPNGMKATECLAALATPSLNRPGLNSFASFPHML